jgi:GT2 family glycosyltransferase
MTQLVISLLVYNQLDITRKCIKSIMENTISKNFLLIISDNASREDTQKYLSAIQHKNIKYIRNDENLGFIKAHNQIFNNFKSKYFCVLNNDLIIKTQGWDQKLINILKNNKDVAQVGPIQSFGCLGFTGKGQPRYGRPLEYIEGSCFIVKSDIVKECGGLFEEKYMNFAFCEDADLSLRLRCNGYRIVETNQVDILHLHHQSFKNEKLDIDFKNIEKQNNKFLLDRWQNYFKNKELKPIKIMINRQAAIGDLFCIEPVIRELKNKYPLSQIFVNTLCPQGIIGNPNVTDYGKDIINKIKYDKLIDLDLAYEVNPQKHLVMAYAEKAEVILDDDKRIPIYYNLKENNYPTTPYYVVNSEGSWLSRTYPREKWKTFIQYLKNNGNEIVEIGSNPSTYLGIGQNLVGRLQLDKTIEIIKKAKLYLGFDGALLHFAQSVGTPSFSVWGCTLPKYRIHDFSKATCVQLSKNDLSCIGCHHDLNKAPKTFTECDKVPKGKTPPCLDGISVAHLIKIYEENCL